MTQWVSPSASNGLAPRVLTVSEETAAETLTFEFIQGEDAGLDEQRLGAGFIVVSRQGQEIQAIEHAFEMSLTELKQRDWIEFLDLDGDGRSDFVVPVGLSSDGSTPIMAAYRFQSETQAFEMVESISNLGEVSALGASCVAVRYAHDVAPASQGRYCFAQTLNRWVQQVPVSPGTPVADEGAACAGATPNLLPCRQSRMALDKELQAVHHSVRQGRREQLAHSNGRQYANQFAKVSAASHNAWLRYRDTRCASHVRAQALPAKLMAPAVEACKHDMALQQMEQYRDQQMRLRASVD